MSQWGKILCSIQFSPGNWCQGGNVTHPGNVISNKQGRKQGTWKARILDQLRGTKAEGKYEWASVFPGAERTNWRATSGSCIPCVSLFVLMSQPLFLPWRIPIYYIIIFWEISFIVPKYTTWFSIISSSHWKYLDQSFIFGLSLVCHPSSNSLVLLELNSGEDLACLCDKCENDGMK